MTNGMWHDPRSVEGLFLRNSPYDHLQNRTYSHPRTSVHILLPYPEDTDHPDDQVQDVLVTTRFNERDSIVQVDPKGG